jgi:hypothetical protein
MTTFTGDGIAKYQAVVIATALKMYATTGMRANSAYSPTAMLRRASEITGQKFRPRDYMGAAEALRKWAGVA